MGFYHSKELYNIENINFLLDRPNLYNKKYKIIINNTILNNDFALNKLYLFLTYNNKFKLFVKIGDLNLQIVEKKLQKIIKLGNGKVYLINSF